jgi:hypothetical protein
MVFSVALEIVKSANFEASKRFEILKCPLIVEVLSSMVLRKLIISVALSSFSSI